MKTKIKHIKIGGGAVEVVLRGKSVAMQADLKKQKKSQINDMTLHPKELGGGGENRNKPQN